MTENIPKTGNSREAGDLAQLMAEIEQLKAKLLTVEGKEREDLELEIEMLEIQCNARKKILEDALSGKLKK